MAWIPLIIEGLGALADIMETITFIEFIQEEAIQAAGLGAFMAMRSKQYSAASNCVATLDQVLIPNLRLVNESIGKIAVVSYYAFHDFVTASQASCDTMKQILAAPH